MAEWLDALVGPAQADLAVRHLIALLVKGVLLLSLAGLLSALLRRAPAATRHSVWFVAMTGLLVLPLLGRLLPNWYVGLWPSTFDPFEAAVLAPAPFPVEVSPNPTPMPAEASADPLPPAAPPVPAKAPLLPPSPALFEAPAYAPPEPAASGLGSEAWWASVVEMLRTWVWQEVGTSGSVWLFGLWVFGCFVVMGQLLAGALMLWWVALRARPVDDPAWQDLLDEVSERLRLTRTVRLLRSHATTMPMTWGSWNPVVLLPVEADTWDADRRRCVLMHELAHIHRWDCATQFVAQVTCALNWFNPLAWMAARQLRVEREKACDDLVLNNGTLPSSYATHLLDIAGAFRASLVTPLGAVAMARPSQLEGRVLAILNPQVCRRAMSRSAAIGMGLGATLLLLPLAMLSPWAAVAAPDAPLPASAMAAPAAVAPVAEVPADTLKGKKARDEAAQTLVQALDTEDEEERRSIVSTLGELGSEVAVEALTRVVAEDPSADIRRQAAWALGEIEDDGAVTALLVAMQDEDVEVRRMAVWALGELEDEAAIPALVVALEDEDGEIRRHAVWALGEIESVEAVPGLGRALRDADPEIRRQAAWALGEIEDVSALDGLTLALRDEDADVRRQAAWALGEIESPRALEALRTVIRDEDQEVRRQVVWAIGQIEDPSAVPDLVIALRDEDAEIRRHAVWALGEIEDAAAVEPLLVALKDADEEIRQAAVWALGEIADARAVGPLSTVLLEDESREVRSKAAWALGEIGHADALDALKKAVLEDEDREVRRQAAWALGQIDFSEVVEPSRSRSLGTATAPRSASSVAVQVGKGLRVSAKTLLPGLSLEVASFVGEMISDPHIAFQLQDAHGQALSREEMERLVEEALGSLDWNDLKIQLEDGAVGDAIDLLIEVAEASPDRPAGRHALRILEDSDDPRARAAVDRICRDKS
jgi:HEAT repeat protein/beta-lactamase regulating signal transducer with metallopeptidase domain